MTDRAGWALRTAAIGLAAFGVAIACAPTARAADGWYIGGAVGGSIQEIRHIGGSGVVYNPDFGPGFALMANGGYKKKALRLEGEMSWRRYQVDTIKGVTGNTLIQNGIGMSATGALDTYAIMGNAYLHLPVPFSLDPYLGMGLGMAWTNFNDVTAGGVQVADGGDWGWAGQAIFGVGLSFIPLPVDLGLEYRFMFVDESKIVHAGRTLKYENQNHTLMLSARYAF